MWSPGEYLVIDWAKAAPGLFLFCAVLAFSRWRFVAFAADQRAATTLALIAEALAAIGGVQARVLADRMACLKGGVVANVVIPTPRSRPAGKPLQDSPPISVAPETTCNPRASSGATVVGHQGNANGLGLTPGAVGDGSGVGPVGWGGSGGVVEGDP